MTRELKLALIVGFSLVLVVTVLISDHLSQARPIGPWSQARALATHPRIAQRARDCGFGVVHESRPTLEAVVACIQSIPS